MNNYLLQIAEYSFRPTMVRAIAVAAAANAAGKSRK